MEKCLRMYGANASLLGIVGILSLPLAIGRLLPIAKALGLWEAEERILLQTVSNNLLCNCKPASYHYIYFLFCAHASSASSLSARGWDSGFSLGSVPDHLLVSG